MSEKILDEKIALITGAGSGIGKAIAKRLAELGASIILFGGRNEDKLIAAEAEIINNGGKAVHFCGDLTEKGIIDAGMEFIAEKFGRIDHLINNAGSAFALPFEKTSEEMFDEIIALDLKVPYFLTQKALPYLRKSDSASIINIASVVAHSGYPNQSAYTAAKHGILGFSKSLARELYKENIRVHVISPGGVYTEMVKKTRPDLIPDEMISADDIADTVEFLLSHRTNAVIDEIMVHRADKEPFLT